MPGNDHDDDQYDDDGDDNDDDDGDDNGDNNDDNSSIFWLHFASLLRPRIWSVDSY